MEIKKGITKRKAKTNLMKKKINKKSKEFSTLFKGRKFFAPFA